MRIQINNISKQYDSIKAIDNITTTIQSGTITGLVGRRGKEMKKKEDNLKQ